MKFRFFILFIIIILIVTGCSINNDNTFNNAVNDSIIDDEIDVYTVNHNPHEPTLRLLSNWNEHALREVWVAGDYAYLSGYGSYIYILDISQPAAPFQTGLLNLGSYGDPIDMISNGNYGYVATRSGLCIIDVSDKTNPLLISYTSTAGTARRLEYYNDMIFLADGYNGVTVYDVSDKQNPSIIDNDQAPIEARKAFYCDGYVYVADVQYGLRIFSFNGDNLTEVGKLSTSGGPDDVFVYENYAYVADRYNGVIMVDITDKTNPIIKAHIITGGMTGRLMLHDNRLFAVDRTGLFAINVCKKEDLAIVSDMATPDQSIGIHEQNNIIYVAGDIDGLFIYSFMESNYWKHQYRHNNYE